MGAHPVPPSAPIQHTHTCGWVTCAAGILHIHAGISRYVMRKLMFIAYIRMKKKCRSVPYLCSHSTGTYTHIHKYRMENVAAVVVVAAVVAAKVAPGTPFTIYDTHFKNAKAWQSGRKKTTEKTTTPAIFHRRLDQGCVDTNTHPRTNII